MRFLVEDSVRYFTPVFLRRIVLILERVIQPDLRAVDQTVYTEDGNDDT